MPKKKYYSRRKIKAIRKDEWRTGFILGLFTGTVMTIVGTIILLAIETAAK